ncbi:MAG TPA: hypothetical protein PKE61_04480, partial [Burkholderiaceae bacterium]|nr:hypothetical protein [Burkholderiaceae bacterium]
MTLWLEFADSEVAEAQRTGTTLTLRLSAAALRIDDPSAQGLTPRSGIARGVRLELSGLPDGGAPLPDGCFGRTACNAVTWSGG